ncbi:MAG: spore coat associated protein CotJA [Clostridia bacterium]|nr:spore coat associated protein CotJA [Clostridia bacterium]
MQNDCLQDNQTQCINSLPLAKAYVPTQSFSAPVSPEEALKMGTLWRELYQPYFVGGTPR